MKIEKVYANGNSGDQVAATELADLSRYPRNTKLHKAVTKTMMEGKHGAALTIDDQTLERPNSVQAQAFQSCQQ